MENIDKITRGQAAQRLLEDELLKESLGSLENNALYRLRTADVNDTKTLQTLVMGLQAASGLRRQLEIVASDGIQALEKADAEAKLSPFQRQIRRVTPWAA